MNMWSIIFCLYASFVLTLGEKEKVPRCSTGKLDVVLVIDVSGSDEGRFSSFRDAALEIAQSVTIGADKALFAIIQYSKTAIMKLEFSSDQTSDLVNDTIANIEWVGDVAQTAEAMDLAMIQFRKARPDALRAIVLFSDGNSFNKWDEAAQAAERLHWSKAKINAVALAGNTYDQELHLYVDYSNGTIIKRRSDFENLKQELQNMLTPGHCPPPPPTEATEASTDDLPTRRPQGFNPEGGLPDGTRRHRHNGTRTSTRTSRTSTSSTVSVTSSSIDAPSSRHTRSSTPPTPTTPAFQHLP